mmetsp:Transcript_2915/g.10317  ORF Transcript_2915/g.10317 Transcript_2915/m.10317 type:complete len:328 (+) Transcript_2915:663-1646(+)
MRLACSTRDHGLTYESFSLSVSASLPNRAAHIWGAESSMPPWKLFAMRCRNCLARRSGQDSASSALLGYRLMSPSTRFATWPRITGVLWSLLSWVLEMYLATYIDIAFAAEPLSSRYGAVLHPMHADITSTYSTRLPFAHCRRWKALARGALRSHTAMASSGKSLRLRTFARSATSASPALFARSIGSTSSRHTAASRLSENTSPSSARIHSPSLPGTSTTGRKRWFTTTRSSGSASGTVSRSRAGPRVGSGSDTGPAVIESGRPFPHPGQSHAPLPTGSQGWQNNSSSSPSTSDSSSSLPPPPAPSAPSLLRSVRAAALLRALSAK